jgi:serine/threonine-protein kinase
MAELQPGTIFAGHRIEAIAGRGGFGAVYRATHLALDHVVALKVISGERAADETFRDRFKSESRIAVSIRHPNVVAVHHAGEEDGQLFVTMDFIDGSDLRGLLNREGRLTADLAVPIVSQVASALDAAHERGLVHRDIKPGNVLIEGGEPGNRVFLTDFGLSKRIDASSGVTATGAFVGTLDYVAPEQIKGDRVDARTDVYALGCVLYELLSGEVPFAGEREKVAKMYAHLQEAPPELTDTTPETPGELSEVVERAMAKDPEDRYPSAGDLARAAHAATEGRAPSEPERNVGVGAAAPTQVFAALADPETAEAAAPAAPTEATPPPPPPPESTEALQREPEPTPEASTAREAAPPVKKQRSGPSRGVILGGVALVAAAAVAFVVLGGGGGDDEPSPDTGGGKEQSGGAGDNGGGPNVPSAGRVAANISVAPMPVGIAVGEEAVWVASREGGQFARISAGDVNRTVAAPGAEGVAVGLGAAWGAAEEGNSVFKVIASSTTAQKVTVDGGPVDVAVDEASTTIWVTLASGGAVEHLDSELNSLGSVKVGASPYGVLVDDDGSVWVTNREDDSVSRISPGSTTADPPIEVGDNPKGITQSEEDGRIWVVNTDDGTAQPIDSETGKAGEAVDVGSEPRDIASGLGRLWVSQGDGTVSALDPKTGKVTGVIEAGKSLENIAVGLNSVWATDGESGEVLRMEPN